MKCMTNDKRAKSFCPSCGGEKPTGTFQIKLCKEHSAEMWRKHFASKNLSLWLRNLC